MRKWKVSTWIAIILFVFMVKGCSDMIHQAHAAETSYPQLSATEQQTVKSTMNTCLTEVRKLDPAFDAYLDTQSLPHYWGHSYGYYAFNKCMFTHGINMHMEANSRE